MIYILAISTVSRLWLASVAEQAGLNLTWSKLPEDTFSRDVAHLFLFESNDLLPNSPPEIIYCFIEGVSILIPTSEQPYQKR